MASDDIDTTPPPTTLRGRVFEILEHGRRRDLAARVVDGLLVALIVANVAGVVMQSVTEVAERTVRVLKRTVPSALPGVVFLSGGQTDENATAHLDAMNRMGAPWPLTFSYSRALQAVALKAWRGSAANVGAAQKAFQHRARMNSLAAKGQWTGNLEKQAA